VLGDSSAAGVGATSQDQALIGHLVKELARDYTVDWQLSARSGATTSSALQSLDQLAPATYDAAFVCLGVNDVKNGMRLATWQKNFGQLRDRLTQEFRVQHLFLSGLPPIRRFPLLPWPLNEVLGGRAALFDQVLRQIASEQQGAVSVPLDVTLDPEGMAADGFHPGQAIYADWGTGLAAIMKDVLEDRQNGRKPFQTSGP
jgi:lysophospholipase L1-like esterase